MKLRSLFGRPALRLAQRANLPEPQPLDSTPLGRARLVVLDLETSGLDTQRDDILSIGAVAIDAGVLNMADQFECTLYQPEHRANQSTLLHEIAPSHIQSGRAADAALSDFMTFAGRSVLLAFHAGFDQRMLARGLRRDLHYRLQHRFLDVAEMAPMLFPEAAERCSSLDDWQHYFHLANSERHNAAADAQATAEILLILLNRLAKQGTNTLAELNNRLSLWRRLQHTRSGRL
ncbi:PolC-type DNA polymerase III [Pseudomonas sp. MYb185]|uniref:3'-5' exonuclease n=1 Tax=Pseudomonas sp. MYb185 TaxID=1848729 RepID=UPI000CFD3087|nr:3'-5' exonuclease [Pseudomonas sp. MYb185]PRB76196.1 DNA polymerase III subunit epsilon [Pseudomonas sp. MYb185]